MKKEYKGRANINLYNCDNMEFMKGLPDNYYDLAIVDPPYGINMDGGNIGGNNATKTTNYTKKYWDISAPNKDYFIELKRICCESYLQNRRAGKFTVILRANLPRSTAPKCNIKKAILVI